MPVRESDLHWSKAFVELHKGTISVESDEKQGTVFTVDLPVQTCETILAEDSLTVINLCYFCNLHRCYNLCRCWGPGTPPGYSVFQPEWILLLYEEEELEKGYDSSKPSVLVIDDNADIRFVCTRITPYRLYCN